MSLFLERLPPLMSHISCVFIGLLLSYYVSADKDANQCFLAGRIFVAFPEKHFTKNSFPSPMLGGRVQFANHKGSKYCLIKNSNAVVIQNDPFIVTAFNMKSADLLPKLLNKTFGGELSLVSESNSNSLKICSGSEIKYGYNR